MSFSTRKQDFRVRFRLAVIGLATAAVAVPTYSFAQAPTFNALVTTSTNSGTNYSAATVQVRSVTIGDLNGDGHPDIVVGNCCGNVIVCMNDGHGTFTRGQSTNLLPGVGGPSVGPGAIVDLNGDGKADYIVASN